MTSHDVETLPSPQALPPQTSSPLPSQATLPPAPQKTLSSPSPLPFEAQATAPLRLASQACLPYAALFAMRRV